MKTRLLTALSALSGIFVLAGCGDPTEPRVYDVPKERPILAQQPAEDAAPGRSPTPSMPPAPGERPASEAMIDQTLPGAAINLEGLQPEWNAPEHWQEGAVSAMRRGSYRVTGPEGTADISITTFPGDVGGLLANVNRWRGQLSLPPIGPERLDDYTRTETIHGREATLVEFQGPTQGTVTAIFEFQGDSWFFRLTGPNALVEREREAFLDFLNTIRFPDV